MDNTDIINGIKKQFYAYRNGILAQQLRNSGHPAKVIFGLNIPQIANISRTIDPPAGLAFELWKDVEVRESRLLATYLFNPSTTDMETAVKLLENVRTPEEADMLCFRLLKRLPFAAEIAAKYRDNPDPILSYLSRSLSRHLG